MANSASSLNPVDVNQVEAASTAATPSLVGKAHDIPEFFIRRPVMTTLVTAPPISA